MVSRWLGFYSTHQFLAIRPRTTAGRRDRKFIYRGESVLCPMHSAASIATVRRLSGRLVAMKRAISARIRFTLVAALALASVELTTSPVRGASARAAPRSPERAASRRRDRYRSEPRVYFRRQDRLRSSARRRRTPQGRDTCESLRSRPAKFSSIFPRFAPTPSRPADESGWKARGAKTSRNK